MLDLDNHYYLFHNLLLDPGYHMYLDHRIRLYMRNRNRNRRT